MAAEKAERFTTTLYPSDLEELREIAASLPRGQQTIANAIRALLREHQEHRPKPREKS